MLPIYLSMTENKPPKIGFELEGAVSHCGDLFMRVPIETGLVNYLSEKFSLDQVSFEITDPESGKCNRFEVKSEPSTDVANAVASLCENAEDLQFQIAQYYRAQHADTNRYPQRIAFSALPPDGNITASHHISGLHIHAEVPEGEREAVAKRLLPYAPMLSGLTLSSPFGNVEGKEYSMRQCEIACYGEHIHGKEDSPAFRASHLKYSYGRAIPRPDTLEFMLCDSTSDPRAIAAVGAIYQALVMKARAGELEAPETTWHDAKNQMKQLGTSGYEEPFMWKGEKKEYADIIDDILREVGPELAQCQSVEMAEYARYIAQGHTCAHKQKEFHQQYMEDNFVSLENYTRDVPEADKEYYYNQERGHVLRRAVAETERDVVYRSLNMHREARTMFDEACPEKEEKQGRV